MSRPSDLTRQSLIEEAIEVFAAKGYEGASVRTITRKANANQAAITYHFGGKEKLYQEVLRVSLNAFSERALLDSSMVARIDRDEAVRLFVRQQLQPLLNNSRTARFLRIFAWESLSPSAVFRDYVATEQIPTLVLAEAIVRRYLPKAATSEDVTVTAFWLANQAAAFIRHAHALAGPPARLTIDEAFVDRLIERMAMLAIGALRESGRDRVEPAGPSTRSVAVPA
jgi:AcrR family transcriptional regulator